MKRLDEWLVEVSHIHGIETPDCMCVGNDMACGVCCDHPSATHQMIPTPVLTSGIQNAVDTWGNVCDRCGEVVPDNEPRQVMPAGDPPHPRCESEAKGAGTQCVRHEGHDGYHMNGASSWSDLGAVAP